MALVAEVKKAPRTRKKVVEKEDATVESIVVSPEIKAIKKVLKPFMIALFSGDKVFLEWRDGEKDDYNFAKTVNTESDEPLLKIQEADGNVGCNNLTKVCMTIDTFAQKIAAQGLILSTPILPPKTLQFSSDKDGQKSITSFYPACKKTIKYAKKDFEDVAIPSIIFRHKFNSKFQYILTQMYMVKESNVFLVSKDTNLYKVPFPNVYNDMHICWGENKFQDQVFADGDRKKDWSNLTWTVGMYDMFFSSPFNNDLFDTTLGGIVLKAIGKTSSVNVEAILKSLQGLETFPDVVFDEIEKTNKSYMVGKLGDL